MDTGKHRPVALIILDGFGIYKEYPGNAVRLARPGLIELVTGQEVFDPTIYYFQEIPTDVEPVAVVGVVCGAVLIAVLASVLPALRAARLHPVEALRYE